MIAGMIWAIIGGFLSVLMRVQLGHPLGNAFQRGAYNDADRVMTLRAIGLKKGKTKDQQDIDCAG
jgi:hypothetical protein